MRRTILADGLIRKNPMILDGAMATELEKRGSISAIRSGRLL
ncbi:hypothetical protein [Sporolactobacillus spathodeae]|uniref:S-methylmethionine-dependent homocysteine/selenocysteine methylase n=1 Tax=Sporolactobacillus spathodeae TaxID=1465502 RepID=A0ABS2Q713_9BACL|nr:hypothetical protein [Sporolactobacillus spathodeae]MBM7657523.1 S-methylmethionine-dependent homocysteine/selenocysteine methylase [Sporolactobacillus spathodeae]